MAALVGQIDIDIVTAAWEAALDTPWDGPDVWVHGDVTSTNLLVADGRLAAVIDFGCRAVGDPPVTWLSTGRSSTAKAAERFANTSGSTTAPGHAAAAGHSGRR